MRRRAAVAGSWYSADPKQLAAEVDRYVTDAGVEPLSRPPRAVIAPHAGLIYSGPVAAFAYAAARAGHYSTAILVGPSHFVPFRGVAIWPAGEWETPFGAVTVDSELAEAVRRECREIVEVPAAHGREHSLEMQLPFVVRSLPGARIVPLLMGYQTRATAFSLGDALARAIATRPNRSNGPNDSNDPNVLLIASSDLSHYEDARTASRMDSVMIQHAEALDADELMTVLEREPRHACGGGPMVAVLHAARRLGASEARVLRYADSGDVSGDKSSVVGYMACVMW